MAQTTIEWTATRLPDGTVLPGYSFNPWWGCNEVSPACDHCYARVFDRRLGGSHWGPPATTPRRFFGDAHWAQPLAWNRKAEREGIRRRVFCASMADVFEFDPTGQLDAQRARLWELIAATPWLDWLLLTKRPQLVMGMVPWGEQWPENVWLGTTVETQRWADLRVPVILRIPARVRFLSVEPLLGPVNLTTMHIPGQPRHDTVYLAGNALTGEWRNYNGPVNLPPISWVICGGESGPHARPMHPAWAQSLKDQCQAADVPFFFKQWGAWGPAPDESESIPDERLMFLGVKGDARTPGAPAWCQGEELLAHYGKKTAGRLLDGRTWDEMPEVRA